MLKLLFALLIALRLAVTGHAASLTPQPVIGSRGLTGLTFAETGSRAWVTNFGTGSPGGEFTAWDGKNKPLSAVKSDDTIDQTYVWGSARVTFSVLSDKTLRVSGSLKNSSSAPVTLDLTLCKIDFPHDTSTSLERDCALEPGLASFDASSSTIPCWFALSDFGGWPGKIVIGQENWGANAQYAKSLTLSAGASRDFDLHLSFCDDPNDLDAVRTQVNGAFASVYPQEHWSSDLRSVGQIFFVTGTGASGWHADHAKWASNPRGWLGDPSINISDKAAFKARMEAFARQCVTNADSVPGVRGFVIWDVEGEQYEHGPCVYVGHPSRMPELAPEMDEIIDGLINILRDGGRYEVGFCLRQQQYAVKNPPDPEQPFWLRHWDDSDGPEAQADLEHEIDWCVARWGNAADIYYVDSNDGNEVTTYHNLRAAYPGFLIYPESFYVVTRMYAYEPQYQTGRQMDYVRNGLATQGKYTAVYPNAQSVINLADVENSAGNVDSVTASMLRGDIQQLRIWWTGGPEFPLLQAAAARASAQGWPNILPPLPNPSPSTSYREWYDELANWIFTHPPTPDKH